MTISDEKWQERFICYNLCVGTVFHSRTFYSKYLNDRTLVGSPAQYECKSLFVADETRCRNILYGSFEYHQKTTETTDPGMHYLNDKKISLSE